MIATNAKPFRLALLRHADAEWPLPNERDFDRRLSLFGETEARSSGQFLQTFGLNPAATITSPARRCIETVALINEVTSLGSEPLPHAELYNSNADAYLNTISQYIDQTSLLVAGHNPSLEELLAKLIGADKANATLPHGLPTSAIAIIDLPRIQDGLFYQGNLIAFYAPSDAS